MACSSCNKRNTTAPKTQQTASYSKDGKYMYVGDKKIAIIPPKG